MAASSNGGAAPKWVIDLHGIKETLTTRSNTKSQIIDAIQKGEIVIMRSVQSELSAVYPDLWDDFVGIKPKKYIDTPMAAHALAAQLQELHGTSVLGGIPDFTKFEAIALAHSKKLKIISGGKALTDCKAIVSKCGLQSGGIIGVADF
jgi:hypothetical protein